MDFDGIRIVDPLTATDPETFFIARVSPVTVAPHTVAYAGTSPKVVCINRTVDVDLPEKVFKPSPHTNSSNRWSLKIVPRRELMNGLIHNAHLEPRLPKRHQVLSAATVKYMWMAEKPDADDRPTVGISYKWGRPASQQEKLVDKLCEEVEAAGYRPVRDKAETKNGDSIRKFAEELAACKYFVAVVTAEYLASNICMYELLRAFQMRRSSDHNTIVGLVMTDAKKTVESPEGRLSVGLVWKKKAESLRASIDKSTTPSHDTLSFLNLYEELGRESPQILAWFADTIAPRGNQDIFRRNDGVVAMLDRLRSHMSGSIIART